MSNEVHISRRIMLKVVGAGVVSAVVGGGRAVRHAERARRGGSIWTEVSDYLKEHPEYNSYTEDMFNDRKVTSLNGASSDSLGITFAEGEVPTLSFIDSNNIARHKISEAYRTPQAPFIIERSAAHFLVSENLITKPLIIDGKQVSTIVYGSDSWGRWGGNAYSVPHLLQEMLTFSGYACEILDVSRSSIGPLHIGDELKRLKTAGIKYDYVIETIEPNTDTSPDIKGYYGNNNYGEAPVDPNYLKYGVAMVKRDVLALMQQSKIGGHIPPSLEYTHDSSEQYVDKFFQALKANRHLAESSFMLVGLPHNNITEDNFRNYDQFWIRIMSEVYEQSTPRAITLHRTFPRTQYDFDWHPRPEGALFIASQVFERLVDSPLDPVVVYKIRENVRKRLGVLDNEVFPAVRELM